MREVAARMIRLPPNSIEAEQALLGGIMLDTRAWDQVADALSASELYREEHKFIFKAIAEVAEKGQHPDAVAVAEHLARQGRLADGGGRAYLARLVRDSAGVANIKAYAKIVRDSALLRRLIEAGGDITASAYEFEGREVVELLDRAEQRIFEIADRGLRRGAGEPVGELLPDTWDRLQELSEREGGITGVATGFSDLDKKTAGLQRGDLIVIAGRPAMGKTALALNIAEFATLKNQVSTGILSMEMSKEQIAFRLIGSIGRVRQSALRAGDLSQQDWVSIESAISLLKDAPIFIDDAPSLSPTDVRARARRLKRKHDLGLIVVDYLQLMQVDGSSENRTTEISLISRSLKGLARELDIPVIALSQLNRSVEQRTNKRPMMSDLRESGAIEQDADLIIFIYREEAYDQDTPNKGVAEVIIGKQRNGETGKVSLVFKGEFTRFENCVREDYGEGVYG